MTTTNSPAVMARTIVHAPDLVIRTAWAALLLAAPDSGIRVLGGEEPTTGARVVARILGARHLTEALLEARHGSRWRAAGAVVDTVHSVTALGFAAADHRWRRPVLTDAAVAAAFAALGAARS